MRSNDIVQTLDLLNPILLTFRYNILRLKDVTREIVHCFYSIAKEIYVRELYYMPSAEENL